MTKAEKNYKRDYAHKDNDELVLNYTCDGLREELENALADVSPDDLSEDEKEYLDGRNQSRNHTLNIRFNDTEWASICRQADLLKMKKSSYVRECAKAHYVLMIDQGDMDNIVRAVRGLSTNVNQIALRANKNGRIYDNDIRDTKKEVEEIWRLLNYIRSAAQFADQLNTSLTALRPEIIHLSELLCVRQSQPKQHPTSVPSESVSEQDEVPPKHST